MSTQALQILPEPRAVQPLFVSVLPPPMPPSLPTVRHLVKLPNGILDFDRSEIRHHNGERDELSVREVELLRYLAANEIGRASCRERVCLAV